MTRQRAIHADRRSTPSQRGRSSRRFAGLLALLALVTVVTAGCSDRELAIRSLMLANEERHRRGVGALLWDDEAAAKAEAWASHLAATGELEHSSLTDGITTEWSALGENVGYAATVQAVHTGFMRSPSHRSTMLAGKYDRAGIGVASAHGVVFVVQVFRG